jgi:hypothetical protein
MWDWGSLSVLALATATERFQPLELQQLLANQS